MSNLKHLTCFTNNAIGIDPAGCGCVDCSVGDSIPLDDIELIQELIEEYFRHEREILNRTHSNMVIYLDEKDTPSWFYCETGTMEILPMDEFRKEEYNASDNTPIVIIHPQDHNCDTCKGNESTPADSGTRFDEAFLRYRNKGAVLYNESGYPLVVIPSYYENLFEVIPVEARDEESIALICR